MSWTTEIWCDEMNLPSASTSNFHTTIVNQNLDFTRFNNGRTQCRFVVGGGRVLITLASPSSTFSSNSVDSYQIHSKQTPTFGGNALVGKNSQSPMFFLNLMKATSAPMVTATTIISIVPPTDPTIIPINSSVGILPCEWLLLLTAVMFPPMLDEFLLFTSEVIKYGMSLKEELG